MPETSPAMEPTAGPQRNGKRQRRPAPTATEALESARSLTEGVKIGRPRTYTPALCKEAIALGMQGKNWPAIARAFGVDRSTLNKWASEFPAFSQALARARAYSQAWWEDDIQENRKADRYQAQAIKPVLYAHFREDYQEARNTVNVGIGMELLDALTSATSSRQATIEAKAKPVEPLDVVMSKPDKG